jgi:hypothetical protein
LIQGAVRPVRVVEVLVPAQHDHQVALIPDQGPVQQLSPAAADPPFRDRIHSRCLNGGADDPDASGLEHGVEPGGEAGVPVMQDELHPRPSILQVHEQVPGLLHHPRLDRVLRDAEDSDPSAAMLDDGQDMHLGAVDQVGDEEVQRQDPLRLGSEELAPARAVPAGRRVDPGVPEDLPDRRRRHRDAEGRELAVDPPVTPRLVLTGQLQHHRSDIAAHRRPTGPSAARQARPPAAENVTMPAQDRGRGHDEPHRRQPLGWQRPGEHSRPRPVRPRQPGMSAGPLALDDSELMAQDQDLGVLPPRLPPRHAQQRHGTGHNEED